MLRKGLTDMLLNLCLLADVSMSMRAGFKLRSRGTHLV